MPERGEKGGGLESESIPFVRFFIRRRRFFALSKEFSQIDIAIRHDKINEMGKVKFRKWMLLNSLPPSGYSLYKQRESFGQSTFYEFGRTIRTSF